MKIAILIGDSATLTGCLLWVILGTVGGTRCFSQDPQTPASGQIKVAANGANPDDNRMTEDQRVTRHLFDQYINRVGKIPTDEIKAAIELVAARGRADQGFRETVLAEFEKRCDAQPQPDAIKRNLLAVMTRWLEIEGAHRWNHEQGRDRSKSAQVSMPTEPGILHADSAMLARVIARGYEADRFDVVSFVFAARQAHHHQAKPFLLDVLKEPQSNVGPFVSGKDHLRPGAKWGDPSAIGDEARYVAAVGLAELGESSGIEWLIAQALPNDFGDGNLNTVQHAAVHGGSLRRSCHAALADLSGLQINVKPEKWIQWWADHKQQFQPRSIALRWLR